MDQISILVEIVDHFLGHHIIRDQDQKRQKASRPIEQLWDMICLYIEDQICLPTREASVNFAQYLVNTLSRIPLHQLVALAFTANHLAKLDDFNDDNRKRLYDFKHCFLNVCILRFSWLDRIEHSSTIQPWHKYKSPILLIAMDESFRYNFSLKFQTNIQLSFDVKGRLYVIEKDDWFVALHLPIQQLTAITNTVIQQLRQPAVEPV
ncbi:MAG: hypothetical protein AAB725_00495 [Patescibacteria group bacterium]